MSEKKPKSLEQKTAEAEVDGFRQDLGPFVVAAETTRMAMVFTNANESNDPIVFANDSFLHLTGYDREEVLGQSFKFLMARGADPISMVRVEDAIQGRSSEDDLEVHYRRKDSSEFWATIFVSPVRNSDGEIKQHFISFIDLTKHKQEQAQLKSLIDELNHRVKNTLATVQSIVGQTLRRIKNTEGIREAIEARLRGLASSHDLLTMANWESVGLLDLVKNALEPFDRAGRIHIVGDNVRFPPKATLILGITFHELATNAAKYGALSNDTGSIMFSWKFEQNRLIFRWAEIDGPAVKPSTHKGFGTQVIERGIAHELEGTATLDFALSGLICTINIPATQAARDG